MKRVILCFLLGVITVLSVNYCLADEELKDENLSLRTRVRNLEILILAHQHRIDHLELMQGSLYGATPLDRDTDISKPPIWICPDWKNKIDGEAVPLKNTEI